MKESLDTLFIKYIKASNLDEDFKRRIKEIEEKLKKDLNHDELKLLIDYTDAYFNYIWTRSSEYFKQGFWIGCEMARELHEVL